MATKNYSKTEKKNLDNVVNFNIQQDVLSKFGCENILHRLPIGIAIVDPETGKFIFVNSNFASILGYAKEELQKRTYQSITHPEDLEKNQSHLIKLHKGEIDAYRIEKRNVKKDGSVVCVEQNKAGNRA